MATRPWLSSSSDSSPPLKRSKQDGDKVCVIVSPIRYAKSRYYLYMFDPDEINSESEPALKLTTDFYGCMATAVINRTLYIFGGISFKPGKFFDRNESHSYSLSSSSSSSSLSLSLSDFTPKSPMASPKYNPLAVVIGDKICVFSCVFRPHFTNFELYDPITDQWSSLPKFPCEPNTIPNDKNLANKIDGLCQVRRHCVEDLVLYISAASGSYCMDFGQTNLKWADCTIPPIPPRPLGAVSRPFLKDGHLAYLPDFTTYNLQTQVIRDYNSLRDQPFYYRDRNILNLPKEPNEKKKVFIVESGGYRPLKAIHIEEIEIPDTCLRLYTLKFDNDDDHDSQPTILNSRLISLEKLYEPIYDRVYVSGIFPY